MSIIQQIGSSITRAVCQPEGGGGGGGGIVVESSSTKHSGTSYWATIGPGFPAGIVADELLIAHVWSVGATDGWNTPAGWTLIDNSQGTAESGAIFWRKADGLESGTPVFVLTNGKVGRNIGQMHRISGANVVAPVDDFSYAQNLPDSASMVCSPITTTVSGCMGMYFVGYDPGTTTALDTIPPEGYVEIAEVGGFSYVGPDIGVAELKNLTITRTNPAGSQLANIYFVAIAPA